jgi:hypothetical protein
MQHVTIVLVADTVCNTYWTSVLSNCTKTNHDHLKANNAAFSALVNCQ